MQFKPFRPWAILTLKQAAWAPLTVFTIHLIASKFFNAYHYFPNLDIPMHFLGGVAIAYFFHHASIIASNCNLLKSFHLLTHLILVFTLTCTATIFWEFSEFLIDRFLGTYTQLGLEDTLFDMFLGMLGGLTWITISQIYSCPSVKQALIPLNKD